MTNEISRTPPRLLMLGCTSFSGFDSVGWDAKAIPNIPDYDVVIVSVPHITEDFLKSVDYEFLKGLRSSLVRLLDSGGKVVALVSENLKIEPSSEWVERISSHSWCPIIYHTVEEAGKSIVRKQKTYSSYLNKMSDWSFYLRIPRDCLTDELTSFYGSTNSTKYAIPLESYLENRYGQVLAGHFHVEVRRQRRRTDMYDSSTTEFPKDPDVTTGVITLLPLIERHSPEKALAEIIQEEMGISLASSEPDWARKVEIPGVSELVSQVEAAQVRINDESRKIEALNEQIVDSQSFRRLLYGTGPELEAIVMRCLEHLGANVSPSKYGEEEYILEYDGQEFLMEVKGVSKSISLAHLRQLNDYLLKYQEDTGKECKGILFGNSWRNIPPDLRGKEDTPEFPDNVIKRAEQWGISLVSSKAFFVAFIGAFETPELSNDLLAALSRSSGLAFSSG